jgi:hypothetical protein
MAATDDRRPSTAMMIMIMIMMIMIMDLCIDDGDEDGQMAGGTRGNSLPPSWPRPRLYNKLWTYTKEGFLILPHSSALFPASSPLHPPSPDDTGRRERVAFLSGPRNTRKHQNLAGFLWSR